MTPRAYAALLLLGAVWGGSFVFIRVAVPAFGPVPLMVVRVTLGGTVLLLVAAATGRLQLRRIRARWRAFLIVGALNSAIPFTLIAFSQLHLTASMGAILNAMSAVFTALIAAAWLEERLRWVKMGGLMLGVVGVGVLVGWSPVPLTPVVLLAIMAALVGALAYGFAGVYSSRAFRAMPPLTVAIGQQAGAAALLLPLSAVSLPDVFAPSAMIIAAAGGLAVLSTSLAYILYFYLIEEIGATRTLTVTYLIPVFGILWGVLLLGEQLTPGSLVGLLMILASVSMVSGIRWPGADRVQAGAQHPRHQKNR